MGEITRHPLCWPDNVARTNPSARARPLFAEKTISFSVQLVLAEINRLNQRPRDYQDEEVIVSTNLRLKMDGLPRGDQGEPADSGAAVYFKLRFWRGGKPFSRHCVLTCDRWCKVAWNLYAIGKDIEAQRARSRWGCTNLEQAFRGYLAIPERCGGPAWWDLLGVNPDASEAQIKSAFLALAKTAHPDKGGNHEAWTRLQAAYEQALARFNP